MTTAANADTDWHPMPHLDGAVAGGGRAEAAVLTSSPRHRHEKLPRQARARVPEAAHEHQALIGSGAECIRPKGCDRSADKCSVRKHNKNQSHDEGDTSHNPCFITPTRPAANDDRRPAGEGKLINGHPNHPPDLLTVHSFDTTNSRAKLGSSSRQLQRRLQWFPSASGAATARIRRAA